MTCTGLHKWSQHSFVTSLFWDETLLNNLQDDILPGMRQDHGIQEFGNRKHTNTFINEFNSFRPGRAVCLPLQLPIHQSTHPQKQSFSLMSETANTLVWAFFWLQYPATCCWRSLPAQPFVYGSITYISTLSCRYSYSHLCIPPSLHLPFIHPVSFPNWL